VWRWITWGSIRSRKGGLRARTFLLHRESLFHTHALLPESLECRTHLNCWLTALILDDLGVPASKRPAALFLEYLHAKLSLGSISLSNFRACPHPFRTKTTVQQILGRSSTPGTTGRGNRLLGAEDLLSSAGAYWSNISAARTWAVQRVTQRVQRHTHLPRLPALP